MADPRPPENVRVVMKDGREIPVECRYEGERDGIHHWVAVRPVGDMPAHITMSVLPAHTSVSLSLEWSE